jgi:imidazolonepropionase-like amidohydrolase
VGGPTFVIRDVHVFDGERMADADTVVVRDGVIAELGSGLRADPSATIVEGSGQTLLPGLIDAHVHTPSNHDWALTHLQQALAAGVTTVLCMGADPQAANAMKRLASRRADLADLRSAGWCATAPGGHPTQWSDGTYPTIASEDEAANFVAASAADGVDYIKIVIEDNVGRPCPCLPLELTTAIVTAAHTHNLQAVAHVSKRKHAEQALASGVNGLAHQFSDTAMTSELAEQLATAGVFVVMTLSTHRAAEAAALAHDPRLAPYLEPATRTRLAAGDVEHLGTAKTASPGAERSLRAVQPLRDAGVTILAGTDAPGVGAVGPSLHLELELLVQGGLTTTEALAAGTSATAQHFGLVDRGRVASGCRADLILVDGDPTTDIDITRSITRVWRGGYEFDRTTFRKELQRSTA